MKRNTFLEYSDYTPPAGFKKSDKGSKDSLSKERRKNKKLKKLRYDPEYNYEEFYD